MLPYLDWSSYDLLLISLRFPCDLLSMFTLPSINFNFALPLISSYDTLAISLCFLYDLLTTSFALFMIYWRSFLIALQPSYDPLTIFVWFFCNRLMISLNFNFAFNILVLSYHLFMILLIIYTVMFFISAGLIDVIPEKYRHSLHWPQMAKKTSFKCNANLRCQKSWN